METIRVLQVVPNMHAAGLETFIMNIYRNIDKKKVQFDFLVHYEERAFYDDEIESLGGKIYRLSIREDKNIIKYIKDLNQFFKEHSEYNIVHGHMVSTAIFYLGVAKKYNVPVRILHSHNSATENTIKGKMKFFMAKLGVLYSNLNLACSYTAGEFLYGRKKFQLVNNAIDVSKFRYNRDIRKKVRADLGIDDCFVIGHIGRFNVQKNHKFLLEIFNEITKLKPNAVLILIGKGELESEIENKINELKLNDKVKLLGVRSDANQLYQALDVFLLPSLFEGLPVVGIESQASGTQTIFADSITSEVSITNLAHFLKLTDTALNWAKFINSLDNYEHIDTSKQIRKNGYDIKVEAEKLIKLYENKLLGNS